MGIRHLTFNYYSVKCNICFYLLVWQIMANAMKNKTHHCCLKRASTPGRIQTGLGPRVYLFLPQAAVLPGSDASSDVVKPALSFVIQTFRPHAPCSV